MKLSFIGVLMTRHINTSVLMCLVNTPMKLNFITGIKHGRTDAKKQQS